MSTPSLPASRLRALYDAVHELHRPKEFGLPVQALVAAVRQVVPHTWTSVDELFLADQRLVHRGGHHLESFTHLAEAQLKFGHGNPNVRYFLEHQHSTHVVKWSDLVSPSQLRDTAYYQEVVGSIGAVDQLALVTRIPHGVIGIALCGEHGFSEEDAQLIRLLQPHVHRAINRSLQFAHLTPATPLTTREKEVLALLANGQRDQDIATQLGISKRTVEQHVAHILLKLETESRTAAAAMAWRARMPGGGGLYPVPEPMLVRSLAHQAKNLAS